MTALIDQPVYDLSQQVTELRAGMLACGICPTGADLLIARALELRAMYAGGAS